LNAQREGREIILFWIPAHKGIFGNEKADSLAKRATTSNYRSHIKIPYSDFQMEVKESQDKQFRAYLEDATRSTGTIHASFYQNFISLS